MEDNIIEKILDKNKNYNFLDIDTLLEIFNDSGISYYPYSAEAVEAKEKAVGAIPKLLKEYFLKIGRIKKIDDEEDDDDEYSYDLLEDSAGCYIKELEDISILTDKELKENYGDGAENEEDDYLVFGFEMISREEFAIKLKDINEENPDIFSSEEVGGMIKETGKVFGILKDTRTLKEFFSLMALSAYEA